MQGDPSQSGPTYSFTPAAAAAAAVHFPSRQYHDNDGDRDDHGGGGGGPNGDDDDDYDGRAEVVTSFVSPTPRGGESQVWGL